jgi:ribosomal protein S18 acetylase RimI-like enzyme
MTHEHATNAAAPAAALHYRRFTAADVSGAHALSMALRWPFRAEDWQFSADTSTAFVAEEDDVVIGTAMCWKYGADRAALGHVIVSSEHQGRGIGRALMEIVLDELGPRITVPARDAGRPAALRKARLRRVRLAGPVSRQRRAACLADARRRRAPAGRHAGRPGLPGGARHARVRLGRAALLAALLARGEGVVLERGGEIAGFAVLRRFGRGHVIGPVVAPRSPDDAHAKALIAHWLRARDGEFVRIDVPSGTCLPDWLDAQGLKRVDTCSKMVRNAPAAAHGAPHDPDCGLYALVSQAMV